jgi:hypothetical protein
MKSRDETVVRNINPVASVWKRLTSTDVFNDFYVVMRAIGIARRRAVLRVH